MAAAVDYVALESERLALRLQEEELQAQQDALLAQRLAVIYACNVDEEDDGDVEFVKEVNPVAPAQEVAARLLQVKEQLCEVQSKQGKITAEELQKLITEQERAARNSRTIAEVLEEHELRYQKIARHDAAFARKLARIDERTWRNVGDEIEDPLCLPPPRKVPKLEADVGTSAAAASSRGAAHPHQPSTCLNTGGSRPAGGSRGREQLVQPNKAPKLTADAGPSSAAGCRASVNPQDQCRQSGPQPNQAPKPNGGAGPSSSSAAAAAACSKGTTPQKPPQQATSAAACAGASSRPSTSHQTQKPQPQSQSQMQQPQQPSRPQPTSTTRPSTVAQMLATPARSSPPSMDSRHVARAQSKAQDATTSSGAAGPSVPRATIECQCCYDRFPPEGVRCAGTDAPSSSSAAPGCGHYFCAPCMTQYVRGAVSDRKCPVPCPMAAGGGGGEGGQGAKGCGAKIPRDEVLELLEAFPKEQQAFTMLEAEQTIDPDLKIYCPHKDCSAVLLRPDGQVPLNEPTTCPACSRAFCLRCLIPGWHQGFTCAQFQALPPHQRSAEDAALLQLSAKQQWKQCPKCNQMVERSEGCNHMKCRCDCAFCYACGKEYRDNVPNRANSHGTPACQCPLFDIPDDDDDVNPGDAHGGDGGWRAQAADAGGRAGGRRGGGGGRADNGYGQNPGPYGAAAGGNPYHGMAALYAAAAPYMADPYAAAPPYMADPYAAAPYGGNPYAGNPPLPYAAAHPYGGGAAAAAGGYGAGPGRRAVDSSSEDSDEDDDYNGYGGPQYAYGYGQPPPPPPPPPPPEYDDAYDQGVPFRGGRPVKRRRCRYGASMGDCPFGVRCWYWHEDQDGPL